MWPFYPFLAFSERNVLISVCHDFAFNIIITYYDDVNNESKIIAMTIEIKLFFPNIQEMGKKGENR